jgi:glucokinase
MPGEVSEDRVECVLIPHWPRCCAKTIIQACKIDEFKFINDFQAMGYGIDPLEEKDLIYLNRAQ